MKSLRLGLATASAIALFAVASPALAAKRNFTGQNFTGGTATVKLTLDDVARTLCGKITYAGIEEAPTSINLQAGKAAAPYPVIKQLAGAQTGTTSAAPINVNVTLSEPELEDFEDALGEPLGAFIGFASASMAASTGGIFNGQLPEEEEGEGEEQTCVPNGPDGGTRDASTTPPTTGDDDSDDTADDDGITPPEEETQAAAKDEGCSTTRSNFSNGGFLALGLAVAGVAGLTRKRRR